jgi:hypothetical protein
VIRLHLIVKAACDAARTVARTAVYETLFQEFAPRAKKPGWLAYEVAIGKPEGKGSRVFLEEPT